MNNPKFPVADRFWSGNITSYALKIFAGLPAGTEYLTFIAGGALRSFYDDTPVKDIDLFFRSEDDFQLALQSFRRAPEFTEDDVPNGPRTPTFRREGWPPFNLIGFRFNNSLSALVASFDFTCCAIGAEKTASFDAYVCLHSKQRNDACSRVLRFCVPQNYERTIKRVERYVSYGYQYSGGFAERLEACKNIPPSREDY